METSIKYVQGIVHDSKGYNDGNWQGAWLCCLLIFYREISKTFCQNLTLCIYYIASEDRDGNRGSIRSTGVVWG